MNLHKTQEFLEWYAKPFRSQVCSADLEFSALCWSVTFNNMFQTHIALQKFTAHLTKTLSPALKEHLDNPAVFTQIWMHYGLGDLDKLDMPVMVNLIDGLNADLWQEHMMTGRPQPHRTGQRTLFEYLIDTSRATPNASNRRAVIDWVRKNRVHLGNILGQPNATFYDIPSKLLKDICLKLTHKVKEKIPA